MSNLKKMFWKIFVIVCIFGFCFESLVLVKSPSGLSGSIGTNFLSKRFAQAQNPPPGEATPVETLSVLKEIHKVGIVGIQWSPSELDTLFSLDLSGLLVKTKIDLQTGKTSVIWKTTLSTNSTSFFTLAIAPSGKFLLAGGDFGLLIQVDAISGQKINPSFEPTRPFAAAIRAISILPSEAGFATGDVDGYVDFWQIGTVKPLFSHRAHDWPVKHLKFSKTGKFLFSGDPARALLWDSNTGDVLDDLSKFAGHDTPLGGFFFNYMEFSLLEDAAVVATKNGVYTYNIATRTSTKVFDVLGSPDDNNFDAIALSADTRFLVILAASIGFLVVDLEKGKDVGAFIDAKNVFNIGFTSQLKSHPSVINLFATSRINVVPDLSTGEAKIEHVVWIYKFDKFAPR